MNPKRIFTVLVYIFAAIGFILVAAYIAVELGWTNTRGIIDNQHDYFKNQINSTSQGGQEWNQGEEWQVLKEAIIKDAESIRHAAEVAQISPRLIIADLVVEQLRLFHSEREVFKTVFAPLKILGNQSQFSWGVMGIKQDTAREIESNLKDKSSDFYFGDKYEHLLDYPATTTSFDEGAPEVVIKTDIDATRFARLTDEHNRYYSYLYAALYMRELEAQWQKAGIPIYDKPAIIATLYNIGFNNSHPHSNPLSGGAEIDIGNTVYSFGSLAESFYDSSELRAQFPN